MKKNKVISCSINGTEFDCIVGLYECAKEKFISIDCCIFNSNGMRISTLKKILIPVDDSRNLDQNLTNTRLVLYGG